MIASQLSGLPEEILEAIDRPHLPDDGVDRRPRTSLVREKVETTGLVDDHRCRAYPMCGFTPRASRPANRTLARLSKCLRWETRPNRSSRPRIFRQIPRMPRSCD